MLIYLLKSSACLAVFMLFYKLFLEGSSIHHFKRFYLLATLLLAFVIPKITFVELVEPMVYNFEGLTTTTQASFTEALPQAQSSNLLPILLWTLYAAGLLVFLVKFCLNLFRIYARVRHNPTYKSKGFIQVLIENLIIPHTFFNYIFLNKSKFETDQIPKEVLLHEQTHAKQKHSIDVVLLELFQIVFWFNPLIYILKNDIKLNHEFLADAAVLKHGIKTSTYQSILLAFSSKASHQQLANAINYSSIKKRFTVMKTQSTPRSIWLRSLLILPLLAFLLFGFAQREQLVKKNADSTTNAMDTVYESVTTQNTQLQKGATKAQLAAYNKLAKHYNARANDNRVIKLKDMKRLYDIYALMDAQQKANAEPYPNFPPPPPPPAVGETSVIKKLPPPPPIPPNASAKQKSVYKKALKNYEQQVQAYTYAHKNKDGENITVTVIPDGDDLTPPPIPNQKGVIEVPMNAQAPPERVTNKRYKKPIEIVEMPTEDPFDVSTKFINIEGLLIYAVSIDGKTKYYNAQGFEVNDIGQKISKTQVNASDVIPGQYITSIYKNSKVMVVFNDNMPGQIETIYETPTPPIPPKPLSPLELVKSMAEKNAEFYYESKSVSSEKAIELLKKKEDLNIQVKSINSQTPLVYITKAPIGSE
ncbi:M56 family metallopeptidase [Subsaximicrobium wynnwilliamsii]|nr:M56 family metallopeptidase [Subsaximicrobium wynnwilliamsii]